MRSCLLAFRVFSKTKPSFTIVLWIATNEHFLLKRSLISSRVKSTSFFNKSESCFNSSSEKQLFLYPLAKERGDYFVCTPAPSMAAWPMTSFFIVRNFKLLLLMLHPGAALPGRKYHIHLKPGSRDAVVRAQKRGVAPHNRKQCRLQEPNSAAATQAGNLQSYISI